MIFRGKDLIITNDEKEAWYKDVIGTFRVALGQTQNLQLIGYTKP